MDEGLEVRVRKLEEQVHILSLTTTVSQLSGGGLHTMLDEIQKDAIKHFFPKVVKKNLITLNSVKWPDILKGNVQELQSNMASLERALIEKDLDNVKKWAKSVHDSFHEFESDFYNWLGTHQR